MTLDTASVAAVDRAHPLGRGASRRGAAGRLVAALPRPYTVLRRRDDAPAVLTRLYAEVVRGRDVVHVVQLGAPDARDVGVELATAGWFVGDTPAYRDLTHGPVLDEPARPVLLGLRTPRIDGAAVRVLRSATAAVVVAGTARGSDAVLAQAVDMLGGLDVSLVGLVVHEGRIPRADEPVLARVSQPD